MGPLQSIFRSIPFLEVCYLDSGCKDFVGIPFQFFFKIHRYGSKDSRPDPSILQSRFPLFKSFHKVSVCRNIFIKFCFLNYFLSNLFRQKTFFWGFVCFYNPGSPPRSPIGLVLCVPSYTLSSPTFKGVTRGLSFVSYERIVSHDVI